MRIMRHALLSSALILLCAADAGLAIELSTPSRRARRETEAAANVVARPSKASTAERLFLEGDYARAITEANKHLESPGPDANKEEYAYVKGLSLLKQKRYQEARQVFEGMRVSFPKGRRFFDALLSIGDTYYLEGDCESALTVYERALERSSSGKNQGIVYYRIGNCYRGLGNREGAARSFEMVRTLAPLSFEARTIPDLNGLPAEAPRIPQASCGTAKGQFSVQVGAFKTKKNAENFVRQLSGKSYGEPYIESSESPDGTLYKVRIGTYAAQGEAEGLAAKLKRDGYATKVCP